MKKRTKIILALRLAFLLLIGIGGYACIVVVVAAAGVHLIGEYYPYTPLCVFLKSS